jgi:hypothetical protein
VNGRIESALPRLRQHWLSCDDLLEMAAQLAAQLAMNFEPIELLAAVRHRLRPERLEVDRERHGPTVVATMPRDVRICGPGLQELLPWDGGADRELIELPDERLSGIFSVVLRRQHYATLTELPVLELVPAIRRYNHAGRWKRLSPSRRRYDRGWQRAPDADKLRYAPLYRKGRHPYGTDHRRWPWWAQHPDPAYGSCRLGMAIVRQELVVYAQPSADLTELLRAESAQWIANVRHLLRCQ